MESIVLERLFHSAYGDAARASKLQRQRVYILPTRHGYIFSIALLTMLIGAINYNNSMAYILTFLLGSVSMVCMVHTYRNLAGLIITGTLPRPVFAGATAKFPIIIDNRNGESRPALELLCSPENPIKRKRGQASHQPVYFSVPGGEWQQIDIPVTATARGLLPLERVIISTAFPLGLFRAWSYLSLEVECVVYPKPAGRDLFPTPIADGQADLAGVQPGVDDFAGFRQYHPGDSIRNIAWKALAREQPLLVKRFSGDGSHTCWFSWNDVMHMQGSELRLSQLCHWLLLAGQQGWTYGLDIPGQHIEPGQGSLHLNRCLEALARF